MAVTPPKLVRDYWPRLKQRGRLFIILMQLVVTVVVGGALVATGIFSITNLEFLIILLAICGASIGVNLIVFSVLSESTKQLLSALVQVSGEPTTTTPPNPNARGNEKSGFKEVLQTVYQLSADGPSQTSATSSESIPSALTTALTNTPCGFVVLDHSHKVIYANKHAPVRTDSEGQVILGLEFTNEQTLEQWLKECEESAVHAEKTWTRISDKLPGEDDRRIFDIVASYDKGSSAEVVLTMLDRTNQYMPEEDDLDFIAFAAHELRGPITVIRGYLDVMQDEIGDDLDPDQLELIGRLTVSANRLSSYVNNILNASRFDRRHLKVHLREDKISDIYDTIADDMKLRATSQNRLLTVNFPSDLPTVAADRGSISEVLGNLIDNAIKYSNEGGMVQVTAAAKGDFVEVSVIDNGIGMPGNVVSSLFHKFYRSHRSRETVAGTGIGLYISKAFVESHGGTIGVRSVEGQGSTFTFSLPIYATVADKLKADENSNESLIKQGGGWIKNHSMYRG